MVTGPAMLHLWGRMACLVPLIEALSSVFMDLEALAMGAMC